MVSYDLAQSRIKYWRQQLIDNSQVASSFFNHLQDIDWQTDQLKALIACQNKICGCCHDEPLIGTLHLWYMHAADSIQAACWHCKSEDIKYYRQALPDEEDKSDSPQTRMEKLAKRLGLSRVECQVCKTTEDVLMARHRKNRAIVVGMLCRGHGYAIGQIKAALARGDSDKKINHKLKKRFSNIDPETVFNFILRCDDL